MTSDAVVTEYQFRPVHPDQSVEWAHWVVRVVPFDFYSDVWGVKSMFEWLAQDGERWVHAGYEDGGRFTLKEALDLASKAQWTLTVSNHTAEEHLRWKEAQQSDV